MNLQRFQEPTIKKKTSAENKQILKHNDIEVQQHEQVGALTIVQKCDPEKLTKQKTAKEPMMSFAENVLQTPTKRERVIYSESTTTQNTERHFQSKDI